TAFFEDGDMNILTNLGDALRRAGDVLSGNNNKDAATNAKRRTAALPSIFQPGASRAEGMPKPTPMNLRRFAETPVARRAINTVKDRIAGMGWRIHPRRGRLLDQADTRIQVLTETLEGPNPDDSF